MRQSSKQIARWAIILSVSISLTLFSARCATVPSSRKYMGPVSGSRTSAPAEESFSTLWEKHTVPLSPAKGDGAPGLLSLPLGIAGAQPGYPADFPLQIVATLMDSQLIEAGLTHYETMLAMTPEEKSEYRQAYYDRYDPATHILIWCELQTTWAELHLDLNRWTIFIQDDQMNQCEPAGVLEEPSPPRPADFHTFPDVPSDRRLPSWQFHQKRAMLLFPDKDLLGNPTLSRETKFLTLIFMMTEDDQTRAEGTWVFRE
jgi:hypothetical protein